VGGEGLDRQGGAAGERLGGAVQSGDPSLVGALGPGDDRGPIDTPDEREASE